ncbi:MAG: hypothetical protein GXO58_09960 [Thermodesulfobacteria bacterium]|nr:hypothetical protein [Thermodesulfobacteriota bacterium]
MSFRKIGYLLKSVTIWVVVTGFLVGGNIPRAWAGWIPYVRASIEELYDSNIFLDPDGYHRPGTNKSDFRTNISSGIGIRHESQVQTISGEYVFNYSFFANNSDQNYAGHTGHLDIDRELSEHLKWYLKESLSVSEEPRTDSYDYVTVNYGRRRNLNNDVKTGLDYAFGPEDSVKIYYSDRRLDYLSGGGSGEDPRARLGSDDSVTYGPGLEITYWFDIHNGVILTYDWTRTDYDVRASERRDHLTTSYIYRFSPHTSVYLNFGLDYLDTKDPLLFDYKIYQTTVGVNKIFSPSVALEVYGGFYYRPSGDVPSEFDSSDNKGFSGGLILTYTQEVWHLTLKGDAGARIEYGDYNNRGYTPYRAVSLDFVYTFNPRLDGFIKAAYHYEKSPDTTIALVAGENRRETYDFSTGLDYKILPWLSAKSYYKYSEESSTSVKGQIPSGYKDHIFSILLSASYDWL